MLTAHVNELGGFSFDKEVDGGVTAVKLQPGETLTTVQKEIKETLQSSETAKISHLRVKEHALLTQELTLLQE